MSIKTSGVGHFAIPTAPAAGTSCTSGSANVFTTTYVQLIASTAAALYITGIYCEAAAALSGSYDVVQLATGAAGSETIVGQHLIAMSTGSTTATGYKPIWPPIPVPISTRISCKTADSVGSKATLITLECLAQSNYVDDGVAVGTVTTVTNQLTAAAVAAGVWRDAVAADFTQATSIGLSVMNGVALGTGLKINSYNGDTPQTGDSYAVVKSGGTGDNVAIKAKTDLIPAAPASTTNITAAAGISLAASQHVIVDSGTITTLSNLPAIPANWITAAGITAAAFNGKGDWLLSSGYTAPPTAVAIRTEMDSNSTKLANLDTTVSSRSTFAGGAVASVTAAITLPSIPANWITSAGINTAAFNGKGDWMLLSSYVTPPTAIQNAEAVNSIIPDVNIVTIQGFGPLQGDGKVTPFKMP